MRCNCKVPVTSAVCILLYAEHVIQNSSTTYETNKQHLLIIQDSQQAHTFIFAILGNDYIN